MQYYIYIEQMPIYNGNRLLLDTITAKTRLTIMGNVGIIKALYDRILSNDDELIHCEGE